jgi:outer membrane biogenesis lipoprotein LolB
MNQHSERFLMAALACALLAGCGGSGGGGDAPQPVPAATEAVSPQASESSAGLVKYLTDLAAAAADDKEPVDLGTFMPKTPEDTEPVPVG